MNSTGIYDDISNELFININILLDIYRNSKYKKIIPKQDLVINSRLNEINYDDVSNELINSLVILFDVYKKAEHEKKFINNKKEFNINSILNKITYIDKNKFLKSDPNDNLLFDEESYENSLRKQINLKNELFKKIDELLNDDNKANEMFKKVFNYNQISLFRLITNKNDTKMITRNMVVEYLFEKNLLQNKIYKKHILQIFKNMSLDYNNMTNSLSGLKDGVLINNTMLDVNDGEEIFDKKNKILDKIKQDFVFVFLFRKNKIISNKAVLNFITDYINVFKSIKELEIKNILEKETVKTWATGVRYLEILVINFDFKFIDINIFTEHKTEINKLCPNLRFL